MIGLDFIGAMLLATSTQPSTAMPSCTAQMRQRGFTTQNDAKEFGRSCLAKQGAVRRKLSRAEVLALLTPMIDGGHTLSRTVPADITSFCTNYARLTGEERAFFWRTFVASMARPESNYEAAEPYWEVDQGQYSLGLLQLSLADERGYKCGLKSEVDLTRPEVNLACGVKILTKLIAEPGARIGGDPRHLKLGGARYWSTLRERKTTPAGAPPADARDEILSRVKALPKCR